MRFLFTSCSLQPSQGGSDPWACRPGTLTSCPTQEKITKLRDFCHDHNPVGPGPVRGCPPGVPPAYQWFHVDGGYGVSSTPPFRLPDRTPRRRVPDHTIPTLFRVFRNHVTRAQSPSFDSGSRVRLSNVCGLVSVGGGDPGPLPLYVPNLSVGSPGGRGTRSTCGAARSFRRVRNVHIWGV